MSARYAILGLLAEQPLHGYRVKKILEERLSPFWGLTTGQIYQSLAAMERIALVESRIERRGYRPARRIYTITAAGKRDLAAWLNRSPGKIARAFRAEFIVRMMFLDVISAPSFDRWLRRESDEIEALLRRICEARDDLGVEGHGDLGEIYLRSLQNRLEADAKNVQLLRVALDGRIGR